MLRNYREMIEGIYRVSYEFLGSLSTSVFRLNSLEDSHSLFSTRDYYSENLTLNEG